MLRERAGLFESPHRVRREHRTGDRERDERSLLAERLEPRGRGAEAPERVGVERDEDDGERHGPGLGEQGERHGGERPEEPSPARAPFRGRHAQVREQCQQVEEGGEHIAALRDPRHGLDAQRVEREEQRREGGARSPPRRRRPDVAEEHQREEVDEHRVRRVERHVRQVIPERVDAPERVIYRERHPGARGQFAVTHRYAQIARQGRLGFANARARSLGVVTSAI